MKCIIMNLLFPMPRLESKKLYLTSPHEPKVYVTENSSHSADLEERLVDEFATDRRCLNWRRGGGYCHHGTAPFFVYLAFTNRGK